MNTKPKIQSTDFQTLYEEFVILNTVKGYKTGQGNFYPTAVEELMLWLETIGISKVGDILSIHLKNYYEHLTTRPNKRRSGTLSDTSINHHLFGIATFFEYLIETNNCAKIPKIPKYHKREPPTKDVLTVEEIKVLYEHTQNKMEKVILALGYGCGLRRTEIAKLETSDISLSKGFLIVRMGKNGKRREVPLSNKVIDDIESYLRYERTNRINVNKPTKAVLVNNIGNRMSGDNVYKTFKRIILRTDHQEIRRKEPTLHTLRHSIATHLTENGADVYFIKEFLGHKEIDTSQLYIIRRKRMNKYKI